MKWLLNIFKKKEQEIPICFHFWSYNTMCEDCRKRRYLTGKYEL